ncbi:MAG: serine hydroxymethyltransferase, partial [Mesorhizobium sp.]
PMVTSGIRLGSPACTTRGLLAEEFRQVGRLTMSVIDGLSANGEAGNAAIEAAVREEVHDLVSQFPIYD